MRRLKNITFQYLENLIDEYTDMGTLSQNILRILRELVILLNQISVGSLLSERRSKYLEVTWSKGWPASRAKVAIGLE